MPGNDSSLFVRRGTLARIKQEPTVTALVPAARWYPGERPPNPVWPFGAYGAPIVGPLRASCMEGCNITVAIHVYAETTGEGDDTVPGEDMAHAVARVLVAALDGAEIDLTAFGCPFPAIAHVQWTGTQVIADNNDGSAWHGVVSLSIDVIS